MYIVTTFSVPESERRLRALTRVLLSRSVWVVIATQLLLFASMQSSGEREGGGLVMRAIVTAFNMIALVYFVAGASFAFTQTREPVGLRDMLKAGQGVYASFLWLMIKAALLSGLVVNTGLVLAQTLGAVPVQTIVDASMRVFPLVAPVAGLIFVYWFPLIFVERDFRLFATLVRAPRLLWHHRSRLGFLALLALLPLLAVVFIGEGGSFGLLLLMSALSSLFSWIAYVYCVEQLQVERIS